MWTSNQSHLTDVFYASVQQVSESAEYTGVGQEMGCESKRTHEEGIKHDLREQEMIIEWEVEKYEKKEGKTWFCYYVPWYREQNNLAQSQRCRMTRERVYIQKTWHTKATITATSVWKSLETICMLPFKYFCPLREHQTYGSYTITTKLWQDQINNLRTNSVLCIFWVVIIVDAIGCVLGMNIYCFFNN